MEPISYNSATLVPDPRCRSSDLRVRNFERVGAGGKRIDAADSPGKAAGETAQHKVPAGRTPGRNWRGRGCEHTHLVMISSADPVLICARLSAPPLAHRERALSNTARAIHCDV